MEENPPLMRVQHLFRKGLFLPLVVGALIAIVILSGLYIYYQKQITIIEGDNVLQVKTFKQDVKSVLEQAGIELNSNDLVEPGLDKRLTEGMEIKISRAVPVVIEADGSQIEIMTVKNTVREVLEGEGFVINPEDKVKPEPDDEICPNMSIEITRVTHEFVNDTKKIPYKLIKKKNESLEKGITRVIQQGKEGLMEVTYKVIFEDGEEVERLVVSENVINEPQDKIEEYGTVDTFTTSRNETFRFSRVLNMIATAYDAGEKSTGKSPGDPNYGITSTGVKAKRGIASVDPKVIPLGTRLYVTGYGFAIAADTGSSVKGNRIDLFHETYKEAMQFGRRKVKVYILAE
ncbi:MAG TPA: DUF348 domain-containing protein [Thermoanaerobacterales bacterium]|nr:DUF348 domain-containing protein [Thermoanaerobacterales bacterium]